MRVLVFPVDEKNAFNAVLRMIYFILGILLNWAENTQLNRNHLMMGCTDGYKEFPWILQVVHPQDGHTLSGFLIRLELMMYLHQIASKC